MKLLLLLIFRDAWYHRTRLSLAVIAMAAMSSMIVWLVGHLDLMMVQFSQDAEHYLGAYQVALIPQKGQDFPDEIIEQLRADEMVIQVSPAIVLRNVMGKMRSENDLDAAIRRERSLTGLPIRSPALIGVEAAESPFELEEGSWFKSMDNHPVQDHAQEFEGVIGSAAAKNLADWGEKNFVPATLGDTVMARMGTHDFKIRIVGIIEQQLDSHHGRHVVSPAVGAVYVSIEVARFMAQLADNNAGTRQAQGNPRTDFVYVQLRDGANVPQFETAWQDRFETMLPETTSALHFLDAEDIQRELDKMRARDESVLMGGAASLNVILFLSSLVAIFISTTVLSMGVQERARYFSLLRAAGMSKRQIALLVFGEGLILAFLGWVGGMAAGWLILQLSVLQFSVTGQHGQGKMVPFHAGAILATGVSAAIASVLAAIYPMWRATKTNILEGLNRGKMRPVTRKSAALIAIPGLVLVSITPLIVYTNAFSPRHETRVLLYSFVGLPCQILGFLMLCPAVMAATESLFGRILSAIFQIPSALLTSQLSSNFFRTLGITLALSVGLGMFSFLEIAGFSMLTPYLQTSDVPDTLVAFLPHGISDTDMATIQNLPGIDSERFLPLAVDQSRFSEAQTKQFESQGLISMQTSAVIVGLDVEKAFAQQNQHQKPLLNLPFQEGNRREALEKLRTGRRFCLVPDSFANRVHVHVGDRLELILPQTGHVVEYEICGIVTIHGWLWMNKVSGVRTRGYRSGAMLLAPRDIVKADYQLHDNSFFWFDRTRSVDGLPLVSDHDLELSLQQQADQLLAPKNPHTGSLITRPTVKVSSREYLRGHVGDRADDVIQTAAKMPLILLAIAAFGLMGITASAMRSRCFELGVLRCLGVTKIGLLCLVIIETMLISLAAITISLAFGILGSWCFIGVMQHIAMFGGFVNPLTIPVYPLGLGIIATIILCLLAALVPAFFVAKTDPSRLLRQ